MRLGETRESRVRDVRSSVQHCLMRGLRIYPEPAVLGDRSALLLAAPEADRRA